MPNQKTLVTLNRKIRVCDSSGSIHSTDAFIGNWSRWGNKDEAIYWVEKIFLADSVNGLSSVQSDFKPLTIKTNLIVAEQEVQP